jgi:hypothetical protein
MDEIKIGQLVELRNDFGTFVSGRVDSTSSFYRSVYVGFEPEKALTYTLSLEGVGSEFRDYEWSVISVSGFGA